MEYKEVQPEDFNSFFELFNKRHPEIDAQLPPSRSLINGSIFCNQPARMPDETYDIYDRFLRRWYADNGFAPSQPDLVYVATNDEKAMEIDTSTITDINGVDIDKARVTIKDKETGMLSDIVILENAGYFRNRVYIF